MRREPPSKNPSLPAIGMAIRALRTDRKLSQETLGGKAGIHPTWISQIEGGRVNPTVGNLALLSEALQVKLSDLIGFAEDMDLRIQSLAPPKD